MITSPSKFYLLLFSASLMFASVCWAAASESRSTTTSWNSFLNLTGLHIGDQNPALPLLRTYLHRFGYLSQNFNDDTFDADLENAIKTYQHNFNLDPTGLLDLPTISQLISPRCGVADAVNGTSFMSSSGRRLYSYFPLNPTWPPTSRHLTYAITSASAVPISRSALRPVFARAFARWSAATRLTFKEVSPDSDDGVVPDITIGFYSGDHGDGEPFDGPLGTLGHAFSPTDGRFHLDAAEDWVAEGDVRKAGGEDAVDLESVAVHEIGHLLGLGHSSAEEAVMFPTLKTRTRKVELGKDDVEGVQRLYGRNPSYREGVGSTGKQRESNGGGGRRGGGGLMVRGCVGLVIYAVLFHILHATCIM